MLPRSPPSLPVDETEIPLTEHLSELRRRLFIILGSWLGTYVFFMRRQPDA